ncbi:MAG: F0F1 ATP synthase subunit epsilon [Xanthomonadales bacterium]|jgi:F-type H+-transporting ATPase subunit epsilon|nr:F0F1 ATP synthase subunit epsilon [Xanthomonadales bacterium]
MKKTIQCDIVSAQEEIFSGEAVMILATGELGELGITPRHAPLITQLRPGPVRVQCPDGTEEFFFVGGGILEVMPHIVTVLADTAVRANDLDEAAASRAKAEAERHLADQTGEIEIAEAQARLFEAAAQLRALEQLRKKGSR